MTYSTKFFKIGLVFYVILVCACSFVSGIVRIMLLDSEGYFVPDEMLGDGMNVK